VFRALETVSRRAFRPPAVSTAKPINPVFPDVFFADPIHILDTDAFAPIRTANIATVPEPSAFVLAGFVVLLSVGGYAVSRWVPLSDTVI